MWISEEKYCALVGLGVVNWLSTVHGTNSTNEETFVKFYRINGAVQCCSTAAVCRPT
jgi:hypothetical protein